MALTLTTTVSVKADLINTGDLGMKPSVVLNKIYSTYLGSGVAVGQADRIFADTRSLAGAATENLDLSGALLDPLGGPFVITKVKGLLFAAAAANPDNIHIGGDVTNTFFGPFLDETDGIKLRPGEVVGKFCGVADAIGYPVVAGTADLLKVLNAHATLAAEYDVIIIGTSA
jgi:hypothetical protein